MLKEVLLAVGDGGGGIKGVSGGNLDDVEEKYVVIAIIKL